MTRFSNNVSLKKRENLNPYPNSILHSSWRKIPFILPNSSNIIIKILASSIVNSRIYPSLFSPWKEERSLPFPKRSSNDSSRKHPPGYPAFHSTTNQQWAKQAGFNRLACWLRITKVGRKGQRRGSADHYAIYAIGRARGPHENLWQVGSVGATTQWRNRRVKIDTRKNGQETGSARAIHPAFCVTDCANDVAVNDLRVVNVADRPFRKIHPPPVGWDRLDSPVFSKISRCFFFFFFLFLTREIEIRNVEREYWEFRSVNFEFGNWFFSRFGFLWNWFRKLSKIHFQANISRAFDRWWFDSFYILFERLKIYLKKMLK